MSASPPPPAATVARVLPQAQFAAAPSSSTVHLLEAGGATRCGHKTAAGWDLFAGKPPEPATVPDVWLCARCTAGLPTATRQDLTPTPAELAAVYGREVRHAAAELVELLARVRTDALVDGAAHERTRLVYAKRADPLVTPRGARPLTRVERGLHVTGWVAAERPLSLLELINHVDPSRPDVEGYRDWLVDEPPVGTPIDVGGTYDARAYDWRRRGHAR